MKVSNIDGKRVFINCCCGCLFNSGFVVCTHPESSSEMYVCNTIQDGFPKDCPLKNKDEKICRECKTHDEYLDNVDCRNQANCYYKQRK